MQAGENSGLRLCADKNTEKPDQSRYGKGRTGMDLGTMVRELGTGMLITTEIFVLTLVFSLPLGMVLAFGRMSRLKVLSF